MEYPICIRTRYILDMYLTEVSCFVGCKLDIIAYYMMLLES
jgi:hypothetical protein